MRSKYRLVCSCIHDLHGDFPFYSVSEGHIVDGEGRCELVFLLIRVITS